ncbi:IclR family acetate operon transcriptional repressor [Spinactinospora alkalitolerans]|uniref:Glycerol operon regulatory protein n=1 Tax=Spinactinospora alkalitolerans TaxID=687207 RepID=A0A852U3T6_9ACTN|nr:IclR family transcriptional regulator [Spinactinospora alkalitolerans]NYE50851.1 IclR family acetate operon transcriptional repressor [Spinactinospora alkalitolerans]
MSEKTERGTARGARQEPREGAAARSRVQSIDRAVLILRCFSPRRPEMGISDLARATGLSTSTTHRILASMQHNGLVRQTRQRQYALGPLLVQLARSGAFPTTLRDAALGAMRELRALVDETVGLHELLPGNERAVVDQVESHHALRRTYTELGVPIPLVYGAPGKAMLAFLDPAAAERVLAGPIDPVTPTTITDPERLRSELEEVRGEGYALSFSERTPGIRTVAAPVFDHEGGVVGSISVSAPEARMPTERMREMGPQVRRVAWSVSEVLGCAREAVARRAQSAWPV